MYHTRGEDVCGPRRRDHAGESVLPGHDGAVRDEPAQLGDHAAQQGKVGTPADVRAHRDQDVALKKPPWFTRLHDDHI